MLVITGSKLRSLTDPAGVDPIAVKTSWDVSENCATLG